MGEPFREFVEAIGDMVVGFEPDGTITYVNAAGLTQLGAGDLDDVIGHNIADYLHPDDLARAFEVVGAMIAGNAAITPARFRVIGPNGTYTALEFFGPPAGSSTLAPITTLGRRSTDHDQLERVLALLTEGRAPEAVIEAISEFGTLRYPGERYAIVYDTLAGDRAVAGSALPEPLLREPDSPVERAATEARELQITTAELPAALAAVAEADHISSLWTVPVPDPLGGRHAVIVALGTPGGLPLILHRYPITMMRQTLRLVLEWREHLQRLRHAAHTDPLTGLANRARFFEALDTKPTPPERVAVLYVDLDDFKPVNDHHGHRVGDEVLRIVAARITAAVRPTDVVGRLGGDEFAVLCSGVASDEEAIGVAERLLEALGLPIAVGDQMVQVGASIGIASGTGPAGEWLLDAADTALYEAKTSGRGRYRFTREGADT